MSRFRWTRLRFSIRTLLMAVFVFSTVLIAGVTIGLQYYFGGRLAEASALESYSHTVSSTRDYLNGLEQKSQELLSLLAKFPDLVKQNQVKPAAQHIFTDILIRHPYFFKMMVGFPHGAVYQLVNLQNQAAQQYGFTHYPGDRWLVMTVAPTRHGNQSVQLDFYDADFVLTHRKKGVTHYDVVTRPWFMQAKKGQVQRTAPYLFQTAQMPGMSYHTKLDSGAVLALGIALPSLSEFLKQQAVGADSQLYIYRDNGELIATNQHQNQQATLPPLPAWHLSDKQQQVVKHHPVLTISNETDWAPINFAVSGQPQGYSIDVLNAIAAMTGFQLRFVNGLSWREMTRLFLKKEIDVIQPVFYTPDRNKVGILSAPFLNVPYGIIVKQPHPEIRHAADLAGKNVAIPKNWSLIARLKKYFPQIEIVEVNTIEEMFTAVQQGQVFAGIDTEVVLQNFKRDFFVGDVAVMPIDFSPHSFPTALHFLVNKAHPEVAQIINQALKKLGPRYRQALIEKWFRFAMQDKQMLATVPYPELQELAKNAQKSGQLHRMTIKNTDYFVYSAPLREGHYLAILTPIDNIFAPSLEKVKTSLWITALIVLTVLPVIWFVAAPVARSIRRLVEDSERIKQRQFSSIRQIDSPVEEINTLAHAMLSMSQSIAQHEVAQQELIEAFIALIAQAIDEKSPYTGGHCERVPELAQMLAQAAHDAKTGPFKDFQFKNEQEWREFRIAAWLHDCGKITTPVHIIDKGVKLECIYNRIHEIRMRFEVLWRDAEIQYLHAIAGLDKNDQRRQQAQKQRQHTQAQLQHDFAFIAKCNIGGESLASEDVARLQQLAKRTWQRHFDDRLGLSPVEAQRYHASQPLPATEFLLCDKPEHIIEREGNVDFAPELGIKMTVPTHLYNLGELYNLTVSRGTLTAEDRFKINEHMISTIKMLEQLPFPPELARVPRYATTHHETLDGTGYPRRLSAADLSVPERIMVVADIFEALTAADRPYKKAKPVSETIAILFQMVEKGKVDRQVFELFLSSGVYLHYARQFLTDDQIDEVDIRQYVSDE